MTGELNARAQAYRELFEERAAIREYDGGLDRERAEIAAWAEMSPDDGDDCLRFIDPAPSVSPRRAS